VLNNPLYDALRKLYGKVQVACEGEQGVITETTRGDGCLIATRASGGEQYKLNCPVCGDTRGRLYISHWAYRVMTKSEKRLCTNGLMLCHNEKCDLQDVRSAIGRAIGQMEAGTIRQCDIAAAKKTKIMELPDNAVPINSMDAPAACKEYLEDRGFALESLYRDFKVHAVERLKEYPEHGPKIIYPVYWNGECVFWQARLTYTPTKEQARAGHHKYYITPGAKKSDYLYNRDGALKSLAEARPGATRFVVLTEGVTDVQRVGTCAMAFFGKAPSTTQRQIIRWTPLHRATGILLLDPDAADDADEFMAENGGTNLFAGGLYRVDLQDKDPAEHTTGEIWNKIIKAVSAGQAG
jgi:hypothetical protein